jgi:hypothetical protein
MFFQIKNILNLKKYYKKEYLITMARTPKFGSAFIPTARVRVRCENMHFFHVNWKTKITSKKNKNKMNDCCACTWLCGTKRLIYGPKQGRGLQTDGAYIYVHDPNHVTWNHETAWIREFFNLRVWPLVYDCAEHGTILYRTHQCPVRRVFRIVFLSDFYFKIYYYFLFFNINISKKFKNIRNNSKLKFFESAVGL